MRDDMATLAHAVILRAVEDLDIQAKSSTNSDQNDSQRIREEAVNFFCGSGGWKESRDVWFAAAGLDEEAVFYALRHKLGGRTLPGLRPVASSAKVEEFKPDFGRITEHQLAFANRIPNDGLFRPMDIPGEDARKLWDCHRTPLLRAGFVVRIRGHYYARWDTKEGLFHLKKAA